MGNSKWKTKKFILVIQKVIVKLKSSNTYTFCEGGHPNWAQLSKDKEEVIYSIKSIKLSK